MSSAPPPHEARLAPPLFRDRADAGLLLGEKVREVVGRAASGYSERSRAFAIPVQPYDPGARIDEAAGPQSAGGEPAGGSLARGELAGSERAGGELAGSERAGGSLVARVFAIPRGGVAVGAGVARRLGAPLDVIVVRKIGHPEAPELGLGAIAEGTGTEGAGTRSADGGPVFDDELLAQVGLTRADLAGVVARERAELGRRMAVYHGVARGSGACDVAVVVDDGLATGVTARAALRAMRGRAPRILLAVPVAAEAAAAAMEEELAKTGTGEVVTLVTPRQFRSVGEWYADFGQLTDADVLTLLSAGAPAP